MDCYSPSSGASTSALSSEITEDHSVLNVTPGHTRHRNHSIKLMKEIAVLEDEIVHLERYLLSLYRTAFQQHISSSNPGGNPSLVNGISPRLSTDRSLDRGKSEISESEDAPAMPPCDDVPASDKELSPAVSSSSRRDKEKKSIYARHMSLAHHLGNSRIENALVCPDKLSEEIMRCIASIYCKLASPAKSHNNGYSTSSNSSYCSSGTFSPKNSWSPQFADEGRRGRGGPYSSMLEVLKISLDKESYNYAAKMLQKFRSLVKSLEIVEPRKMSREEKLAFWINIHNALVMHGYLAYGTQTCVKTNSVMKASYNVGGNCVNAHDIQSHVLGIKAHSPVQWLQTLLSPGKKLKSGNYNHPYAIEYPEPLVHFALCSGIVSDPAVRVYSAKTIFDDLKLAMKDFIQSTMYVQSQSKLCLPKILRLYARDMSIAVAGLVEIVNGCCLTAAQQKAVRRILKSGRPEKYVYWIEQNTSSFRYLIHQDLAGQKQVR